MGLGDIARGESPAGPAAAGQKPQEYQSLANGIAFQPPAGMTRVRPPTQSGDFVHFVNKSKGWLFKGTMKTPQQPLTLFKTGNRSGMMELTLSQLKEAYPGLALLRQDQIMLPDGPVGMLAVRYSSGMSRILSQFAIFQADQRLFYILNLTSPAAASPDTGDADPDAEADPREADAAAAFSDMVDTLRLVDRTFLQQDQEQRLFRTRALFTIWNLDRVQGAMVREQWLRIVQNGRDIGHAFVAEDPEVRGNTDGVMITMRTWLRPDAGQEIQTEASLFCTVDRAHESWTRQTAVAKGEQTPEVISEVGASDLRRSPGVEGLEEHNLSVTYLTPKGGGQPIRRALPPFYLPQAFGHMLPRLLPLDEAKTYLFASYVSDEQEVMLRYVDVGQAGQVVLDGKKVQAIPVLDYVGLEGVVTRHYLSPEGQYLGSVTEESGITILPTDAATIDRIWQEGTESR